MDYIAYMYIYRYSNVQRYSIDIENRVITDALSSYLPFKNQPRSFKRVAELLGFGAEVLGAAFPMARAGTGVALGLHFTSRFSSLGSFLACFDPILIDFPTISPRRSM